MIKHGLCTGPVHLVFTSPTVSTFTIGEAAADKAAADKAPVGLAFTVLAPAVLAPTILAPAVLAPAVLASAVLALATDWISRVPVGQRLMYRPCSPCVHKAHHFEVRQ